MATNLRLRPDAEAALRVEAARSGRSQQEILRDALDRYLDLAHGDSPGGDALLRSGTLLPPRTRYRRVRPTTTLPAGTTSLELLDRDERL
ncbi:MAG: ribbon-helix-helix domain-containing protein [Actinomycetota bacterium]|nr:ribbon-helix-helix domain-containing protein [Actinomycetota bacterium]